jgi:PII-like signaling protein
MARDATMLELQVFFDESDEFGGKPLAEVLLHFLLQRHVTGATLFRGEMGFGSRRHIHHPNVVGSLDDVPVALVAIEEEEILRPILPEIKKYIGNRMAIVRNAERL